MANESRVHKLANLLDSKNAVIRKEAIKALGTFPVRKDPLLNSIHLYLTNPNWSTRVAASEAIGEILQNFKKSSKHEDSISRSNIKQTVDDSYSKKFEINIDRVSIKNKYLPLLSSNTEIYSPKEINEKDQFTFIKKECGIDDAANFDIKRLVSKNDFIVNEKLTENNLNSNICTKIQLSSVVLTEDVCNCKENFYNNPELLTIMSFGIVLLNELANECWHVRHGSALALHKLIIYCFNEMTNDMLKIIFERLFHVLVLDEFNDFATGSNATAPVREAVAQCFVKTAVNCKEKFNEKNLILSIKEMFNTNEDEWICKQTCLIILKYYFVIAQPDSNYEELFKAALQQLEDGVDEVMSAAMAALSAVFSSIHDPSTIDHLKESLIKTIWTILCNPIRYDKMKEGIDSLLLDNIKLLEIWAYKYPNMDIDEQKLLLLVDMIDPGFVERTRRCLNIIQVFLKNPKTNCSKCDYSLIQKLYRCILFSSFENCNELIESTFACLFALLGKSETSPLFQMSTSLLISNVGLWISCLCQDAKDCAINVNDYHLEGEYLADKPKIQYLCGAEICGLDLIKRSETILERKVIAARFLAPILESIYMSNDSLGNQTIKEALQYVFLPLLQSKFLFQKLSATIVLNAWARFQRRHRIELAYSKGIELPYPQIVINAIEQHFITTMLDYEDCRAHIDILQKESAEYTKYLYGLGIPKNSLPTPSSELTYHKFLSMCKDVASKYFNETKMALIEVRSNYVLMKFEQVQNVVNSNQNRLDGYCSSTLLYFGINPPKLTPLIKPLFSCLATETNKKLAEDYIRDAFALVVAASKNREPSPQDKILSNLIKPIRTCEESILYLNHQKTLSQSEEHDILSLYIEPSHGSVKANNAKSILQWFIVDVAKNLQGTFPGLYDTLELYINNNKDIPKEDEFVSRLEIIKAVTPYYSWNFSTILKKSLTTYMVSENSFLRFQVVHFLACIAKYKISEIANTFYDDLIKYLECDDSINKIAGAIELLFLISKLENESLGLGTLFAPHALRLMSNRNKDIRMAAANCFRNFVPVITLEESSNKTIEWYNEKLKKDLNENRNFMKMLSCPAELPIIKQDEIEALDKKIILRPYQLEGITWLLFLNKYGLNGILADDMGLGKTLQTLCLLNLTLKKTKNVKCLIICPVTLIDHWCAEWSKYFPMEKPCIKTNTLGQIKSSMTSGIYVGAYEEIKIGKYKGTQWEYLILDEGHIIRRSNTILFENVVSLRSKHRLILSGTPVQNSPADLWSLFSFLMPDYLPDKCSFNSSFVKPIQGCRSSKANEKTLKEGEEALQKLHKIVLPFILRRMKTNVLDDLPDKTVSDYYCELTDIQRSAYELIVNSCAFPSKHKNFDTEVTYSPLHVCVLLRKLVDHPIFVVDELASLKFDQSINGMINESGKLMALKELLNECEVGIPIDVDNDSSELSPSSFTRASSPDFNFIPKETQHRVLIFCQWASSINYLKSAFQSKVFDRDINFLTLDSSVPPNQRFSIAEKFNGDPTYDVLILSTHIGGVGLNLTGADVVIFFDHDWNPVKDLQAIDRAHRIGQKKNVMVYRLITKETIEEKVMNLQQFKTNTANVIVGADNSSLKSMDTSELIDLFSLGNKKLSKKRHLSGEENISSKRSKITPSSDDSNKTIEETWNLDTLWSESDYTESNDLNYFANNK
uniref:TATA-binding protein-associated factor 172 (inferred by orthology to a human protein) n=1 Tax=Strongyloides venezuelensis TaxID=75913 RepID=A0A0K0FQM0_STRVS